MSGETTSGEGKPKEEGVPPAAANPKTDGDLIAEHLCSIVRKMVSEHMQWVQGFQNWANQMLMNMQQIPPQAHMDFANRQKWIGDFLAQFDEIGAILKRNGNAELADLLADYSSGFDRLAATQQEVSTAMMKEDAETQRKLAGIQAEIAAENLKAAAERHRLQKEAAAFTYTKTAEGIAATQKSFGTMNDVVKKGLFG